MTADTIKTADNRLKQGGNAMVYVLIALALFGFLTITLSRSNNQASGQDIDDEQAKLYASELMEYAASAQIIIEQMLDSGSEITELDFIIPSDAGFNTPPHFHKIYHPQGGGLNHQATFNEAIHNGVGSVWAVNNQINVEWTKLDTDGITELNDVILTAYFVSRQICEIINEKITGDTTIHATTSLHADHFLPTGTTDFTTTECVNCNGRPALCVREGTSNNYSFYSIIATRQ